MDGFQSFAIGNNQAKKNSFFVLFLVYDSGLSSLEFCFGLFPHFFALGLGPFVSSLMSSKVSVSLFLSPKKKGKRKKKKKNLHPTFKDRAQFPHAPLLPQLLHQ